MNPVNKKRTTKPRESLHLRVARIIYAQTQAVFPNYSHRNSPKKYTLPQLAACVQMAFYFKMSYRDFVELLHMSRELREALELQEVPHYSTLSRMYQRFRASHLDAMNRRLLQSLGVQEEVVALDSTGFRPTQASAYFQSRRGKPLRSWVKGSYAVGTSSQMILGVVAGRGPSGDYRHLSSLKRGLGAYTRRGRYLVVADRGFDGKGVGPRDLIPPIRRGGALQAAKRRVRAELVEQARLDGVMGQRWKSETVNSVLKRKFGEGVRSRKPSLQKRECRVKALVYNAYR